jgi:trimeric autotransporter adhesin
MHNYASTPQNKAAAASEGDSSSAIEQTTTTAATQSNSATAAVDVSLDTADTAEFTNPAPSPDHNSPSVRASPGSRTDGQGRVTSLADSGSQTEADLPTTAAITAATDTATATADSAAAATTAAVLVEPGPQPELPVFNPELMRAKAPLAAPAVQSSSSSGAAGVHAAAGEAQGGSAGAHTEGVSEGAASGAHQIDGVGAVPAAKAGCRCTVM